MSHSPYSNASTDSTLDLTQISNLQPDSLTENRAAEPDSHSTIYAGLQDRKPTKSVVELHDGQIQEIVYTQVLTATSGLATYTSTTTVPTRYTPALTSFSNNILPTASWTSWGDTASGASTSRSTPWSSSSWLSQTQSTYSSALPTTLPSLSTGSSTTSTIISLIPITFPTTSTSYTPKETSSSSALTSLTIMSTTPSTSPSTSLSATLSTASTTTAVFTSSPSSSRLSSLSEGQIGKSSSTGATSSTIDDVQPGSSVSAQSTSRSGERPTSSASTSTYTLITIETVHPTTTLTKPVNTVPDSILTSLTTSAVQSATISVPAATSGSILSSLETSGNPSTLAFPTSIASLSSSLSLVNTATLSSIGSTATVNVTTIQANGIFAAIETDAPPSQIPSRGDHPVPTLGIQKQQQRYQTNKFYANFFLGDQTAGTWTQPYSVAWSKGVGQTGSWGLSVSHIDRSQLGNGSVKTSVDAGNVAFIAAPVGIQSLVLSAAELQNGTTLTTSALTGFSANINLSPAGALSPLLTFPLVQGMAFVTAKYSGGTPILQSGVGIESLTYAGAVVNGTTYKYRAALHDGSEWLVYLSPASSSDRTNAFTLLTSGEMQGPSGFTGYLQVAKVPEATTDAELVYDAAAGVYPTSANITGAVSGTTGSYTLFWTKEGVTSRTLLMFALPHHVESLSNSSGTVTDIQLVTISKGYATAICSDSWTLVEPSLPISMGFRPWSPQHGDIETVSASAALAINAAGFSELSQNMSAQANVGSLYFDGKALAKFAAIIIAVNEYAGNKSLALTGLEQLEEAFEFIVNNRLSPPIVYDTVWGGVVSEGGYGAGDAGVDFGNTYYNDHHFHYGYFVYVAAVIAHMRPAWLSEGTNKAWVNMLVRDFANPIADDPYFPFQRMFDWYNGHSWAGGIIESFDGKNQESSSEDTMSLYAIKMWGRVIGDTNMEARGNLMLSVQARSLQNYYLMTNNNTNQPSDFVGNCAAGILFDNKIDHTTYFGAYAEYVEGIHMLPLLPSSTLTRTSTFASQEWNAYFGSTGIRPVNEVGGGWRGILVANQALFDPVTSYDFFSTANFNASYLDGGASQTWYLAFSAALGGSPATSKDRRPK